MPTIKFTNQSSVTIIGYVGTPLPGSPPAQTTPIKTGESAEVTVVPMGPSGWMVTIQLADAPPLRENSPASDVWARSGGVDHANVFFDAYGKILVAPV
jgi:hypothetical protein